MSEQQDGQPDGAEVHAAPERVALSNDLARRFAFHPADTGSRRNAHGEVRALCHNLAERLVDLVPPGRERATMLTNLEQVMMWGNAGIARWYAPGDEQHAQFKGDVPLRERTAGSLELTEPDGPSNPAHLVETEDMQPGVVGGIGDEDTVPVPTVDGGTIHIARGRLAERPAEAARWDPNADGWAPEPDGGQPPADLADPQRPTSP